MRTVLIKSVVIIWLIFTYGIALGQDSLNVNGSLVIEYVDHLSQEVNYRSQWFLRYDLGASQLSRTWSEKERTKELKQIEKRSQGGVFNFVVVSSSLDLVDAKNYEVHMYVNEKEKEVITFSPSMGECCRGTDFYNYLFVYLDESCEQFKIELYSSLTGTLDYRAEVFPDFYVNYKQFYQDYRKDWPTLE